VFNSPRRTIDGNCYGLLIHSLGAAVGPFQWQTLERADILVEDVVIEDLRSNIIEVVILVNRQSDQTMSGPAADRLRISSNLAEQQPLYDPATGAYVGTFLSDTQIALAAAVNSLPATSALRRRFGTLHISDAVIDWAHHRLTLGQLIEQHGMRYRRNGDAMMHLNKGVTAVRIDGVSHVVARRLTVRRIRNDSPRGNCEQMPGETEMPWYEGRADGGHVDQGLQHGYMGADVRGVAVSGSSHIWLSDLNVSEVHSVYGNAKGLDIFNFAYDISARSITVDTVTTLPDEQVMRDAMNGQAPTIGRRLGTAIGVHEAQDTDRVFLTDIQVKNVDSSIATQAFSSASEIYEPRPDRLPHKNLYEL